MSTNDKTAVETLIIVEGQAMSANLQPPQSELQEAFRIRKGKTPGIVIDMDAALVVAQNIVRQARADAFKAVDARTMRATRTQDAEGLRAANAHADKLSHAPQDHRLSAATTPDELLEAIEQVVSEF